MKKTTRYLSWFTFILICGITLTISCTDNGGGPQQSSIEISRISPDSGRVGSKVTVYSENIDPIHENNQIELNGIDIPILSYGSNSLVFEVPEGATSGPVTLRVQGKVASGPYFKVLTKGPEIAAVTPARGGPGTQVTITGEYFLPPSMLAKTSADSTAQGPRPVTGDSVQADTTEVTLKAKGEPASNINGLPVSVSFGDELAPLLSLSATEIIVEVPEKATSSSLKVTVGSKTATSNGFTLLRQPLIEKVTPTAGPAGTKVTITGHYFSSQRDSNQVRFNGTAATILLTDSTKLIAAVPHDATTGLIEIISNGQAITGPTFTVSETPVPQPGISDLSPKLGPAGTQVTITGQNFSSTADENTITFNGTKASVSSASETELVATVPQGATNGPVKVTVDDQTAEGPSFTVTEDPDKQLSITNISPKEGPVGTTVTITGQNFSPMADENTVTFNGTKASVSSASTTELVVAIPQNATSGPVNVSVGSQTATGPTFTVSEAPVPQPGISDLSPKSGPAGTQVTITGQNFSSTADENTVTFNGTEASVSSASETELVATVPQAATNGPVKVTVDNQTAGGPSFTVTEDPDKQLSITNISPKEGPVGTTVTITGINFSTTASENVVTFNGSQATVSSASTTELVANVPSGTTSGPVTVKVGSQTATGPTFTVGNNAAPTITGEGSFTVEENTTAVATITASDPDGDALTFGLSGGTDRGAFSIDENSGALAFSTAPDFDNPGDENADNSYQVEVKVSDSSVSVTKTITVTVTNVDEAPVMVSPAILQADENSTDAGTIVANDPEGNAVTYIVTGGDDAQALTLDQNSGKLTFNTAPDFESPADANTDNRYETEVTLSDGNLNTTKTVTITLQNVNEAPVITSATSFETQENSTTVGTITASDPEGDALDFALLSGTKGTLTFSTDASSGEITISPAPDFETPRDDNSDNTYEMDVSVADGVLYTTQLVKITVTNVAEVPSIDRGTIRTSNSQTYLLNRTNQENVFRFDPVPAGTDLNNALNFSLGTSLSADLATSATVTGGADGGLFSVNSLNVYAIHLDGPILNYNHSADGNAHEYRFTVTAENAAGVTQPYTIIIPVQNPFTQGSGTAADPYQVETIDQLQVVNQFLDAHFVQATNIDASATAGWNGGQGFKPIGDYNTGFSGSYDGDGYTISGLTMDRTQSNVYGLFGVLASRGQLSNVRLTNIDITTDDTAGGLVGGNQGTITDSYVSGTITSSTNGTTGGLVGENNGVIRKSYSLANVNGRANVGGLVGTNYYGTITNSYATGNVDASLTIAGGLVGNNKSVIEHSYATGAVSAGSTAGGLVGYEDTRFASVTATESYWDTQTTGLATSDGGTGLATSQMQGSAAETNMIGFDFTNVWQTNAGDYPSLRSNP
ncbi:IPT/TIG domain-containing protein [Fodinibius sediminis]|nr:IPT/TIG domain-containing protein [Fodinibius sediminis]